MKYGFSKIVPFSYENAVSKVTEELTKGGFGVLASIDMKETMKKKLNLDFPPYLILGVCNPAFAYRALEAEEEIGLLLPCNLLVYTKDGKTVIAAFDPVVMTTIVENPAIPPIAAEMKQRLERVIEAVK